jgi:PAS domain S-box-containing protein
LGEGGSTLLSTAIEQAGEAVVITDAEGMIQYANPVFETITGYASSEVLGQNPRILKSGKQSEEFYQGFWETISSGKVWDGRFVNKKKDGSFYHEDATVSPVRDAAGNIASYVAIKRDVTDEAEIEAEVRHSQKTEATATFAGGIAHDFNNLLSPVLGYTELAMADLDKNSETFANLEEVMEAGRRASEVVRQVMTYSKQHEAVRRPLRLGPVVEEALRLEENTKPDSVELVKNIESCRPVVGDPAEIHAVLRNLCANAYNAMGEKGGTLTVELKETEIKRRSGTSVGQVEVTECAEIRVTDFGCGMDEETRLRAFDPYFTTNPTSESTGMGLATVHGIVTACGGRIDVQSEVDVGTTFSVFLPVCIRESDLAAATEDEPELSGSERVLIVADKEAIAQLGKRGLDALGYTTTVRTSSLEALEMFQVAPERFDVAILDEAMPNMTGTELAGKLLEIRPKLPVILSTTFDSTINERQLREMGIQECVTKPVTPQDLAHAIRGAMERVGAGLG